jgi:hypothetical protein
MEKLFQNIPQGLKCTKVDQWNRGSRNHAEVLN